MTPPLPMAPPRRMVVTGREGQVVMSLKERARPDGLFEIIALGRPELDLLHPDGIETVLRQAKPDVIVSAAAYTAVDRAESDEENAKIANGVSPGRVAAAAAAMGVPVIHLSTDYVFDGSKPSPYDEDDPTAPINVYGRSKLAGEEAVVAACPDHVILRTAWLAGPFGNNFLRTMMGLAQTRDSINVVDDQIGNPTSSLDVADALLQIATNLLANPAVQLRGRFHMTGNGEASWADFAAEIFRRSSELGGPGARIRRISGAEYPTPARRPRNSRLDCSKLQQTHRIRLQDWKAATGQMVQHLLLMDGKG